MYPDVQNEPLPNEYQTKQRTIETKLLVSHLIDILRNENNIPELVKEALLEEGFDVYVSEEITSLVLNMSIEQSREVLRGCLTRYITCMFNYLFAWDDRAMCYSANLDLYK